MRSSSQLHEVYVIASKRPSAAYDVCVVRGMTWPEIADDEVYREAVADSEKALDAWIKTWGCWDHADK